MVRGRKRDVTAPLTRSLVLQRDYRARKAKYVSDLEAKCQDLEEQNARLLEEVKDLRDKLHQRDVSCTQTLASLTTEAEGKKAHALSEVLSSLSSAVTSIQTFQRITLGPHFISDVDRKSVDGSGSMNAANSSSHTTMRAPKPSWPISLSSSSSLSLTPPNTAASLRPPSSDPPSSSGTSSYWTDVSDSVSEEQASSERLGRNNPPPPPLQLHSPISNTDQRSRSRSRSNATTTTTDLEHDYSWESLTRPSSGGSNGHQHQHSRAGNNTNTRGLNEDSDSAMAQSEPHTHGHLRSSSRHHSTAHPSHRPAPNSLGLSGVGVGVGVGRGHGAVHTHTHDHHHNHLLHQRGEPFMMDYVDETSPVQLPITLSSESLPRGLVHLGMNPPGATGVMTEQLGIRGLPSQSSIRSTATAGNPNSRGTGGLVHPPYHHQQQQQHSAAFANSLSGSNVFAQDIHGTGQGGGISFDRLVSQNSLSLRTWGQ